MSGFDTLAAELVEAGRELYRRGWVPATSGNFSARLDDGTIAITASGRHKGRLTAGDILRIDAEGRSLDGRRPSAETGLHLGIYRRFPEVRAVLHPHSPAAVLASRLFKGELVLADHELLKALDGIDTHAHRLVVPIFANDQDIPRLARQVDQWIERHRRLHAYIIAGHGFYAWGRSVAAALTAVEALEFMFDCEVRLYGVRS
ncbi:methylthioribulose-1-phosphate dehydratase [Methylomarinovum tepidoasis]|uniref:Methylthioribulose-1-phosphate dehydratase n=1 Tax=Methylomarinovum tepidoasis TaxID=2840183 RepID=A0AAU9C047_9GAMM|nr:methylthioribulose 1-phosphate dehydratase [Methylomarinovum sp. IN45]BCX89278.1 methylthioribulose-1-phosphate dehydratase [Methylomarinovum sp. IN45]